jgi:hypothetical protein
MTDTYSYVEGGVTHELSRSYVHRLAINGTNDLKRRDEGAIVWKKSTNACVSSQYYTQFTPAEYISIYDVNRAAAADILHSSRRRGFNVYDGDNSAALLSSSFDDFNSGCSQSFERSHE